jgi:hypothetical protein
MNRPPMELISMSNDLFLISEATLKTTDEQLGRLIEQVKHEYGIDAEDDVYGPAFRYYLLFDRWPWDRAIKESQFRASGKSHPVVLRILRSSISKTVSFAV